MPNQDGTITDNEKRVGDIAKMLGIEVVSVSDLADTTTLHFLNSDGGVRFVKINWTVVNEKGAKSDEELGKYILELISQI